MKRPVMILSIDDDNRICFALDQLFKFQGWCSCTANSVESGLTYLETYHPDIVLIDYHMPVINGIEGVKMIRKKSPDVPIIVFTVDESQEVADAFLAAGATDFALKPIKAPDIVSRIRLHLMLTEKRRNGQEAVIKGISPSTKDIVLQLLKEEREYLTANEIADRTGLAYQTVYRYLQHMTQSGQIEMLSLYGKVGRPKQVYRVVR